MTDPYLIDSPLRTLGWPSSLVTEYILRMCRICRWLPMNAVLYSRDLLLQRQNVIVYFTVRTVSHWEKNKTKQAAIEAYLSGIKISVIIMMPLICSMLKTLHIKYGFLHLFCLTIRCLYLQLLFCSKMYNTFEVKRCCCGSISGCLRGVRKV